jgi:hypothetical protein
VTAVKIDQIRTYAASTGMIDAAARIDMLA